MTRPIPETLEMVRRLVAIPSVSSVSPEIDTSNRPLLEELAGWLEALGFSVEIRPLAGHPGKANLVAVLGEGSGGLALAGHSDTVPYDAEGWDLDPFAGTVREDALYGLGSADMKGFLALAVEAASAYRGARLEEPLRLIVTADEESSMTGARALAEAGEPLARYAVVGEPTSLRPVRMHKGIMMERIRLIGASGHSSNPALGRNALEGMHRVIAALLDYRERLQRNHRDPAFTIAEPTLNLGHIRGGDNPNRICASCELLFDVRLMPGMGLAQTRRELRQIAEQALAGSDLSLDYQPLFDGVPAMETAADSAIVTAAEALTGHRAGAVAFGTEGPFYNALGMETVILGPGDIDHAHQPNERLPLDQVEPTIELLRGLIERFCVHPEQARGEMAGGIGGS